MKVLYFFLLIIKYLYFKTEMLECYDLPNQNYRLNFNTSFELFNCFFYRTNMYSGQGGVIYCKNLIINMKIIESTFFQCSSTLSGGAIFFDCRSVGTNSELKKICANTCYTGNNYEYQFASLWTHTLSNNYVTYVSIINCSYKTDSSDSIHLYSGNQICKNFNSSKNFNKADSSFYVAIPNTFLGSFCTIIDNYVTQYICIMLNHHENNIFSYSNIVNNNSPNGYGVIRNHFGSYQISNCIIYNNLNILFYSYSGNLNILNCQIYHNSAYSLTSITSFANISFNNIQTFNSITLNLNNLNTFLCLGNYNETYLTSQKTFNKKESKTVFEGFFIFFFLKT